VYLTLWKESDNLLQVRYFYAYGLAEFDRLRTENDSMICGQIKKVPAKDHFVYFMGKIHMASRLEDIFHGSIEQNYSPFTTQEYFFGPMIAFTQLGSVVVYHELAT